MNETRLNTFLMTVEMRSFSRCADVLGTKQSTVSSRITQLESELGVVLFERGRSGAHLTRAGKEFENHCRALLSIWGQAKRDVSPEEATVYQKVHISAQCNLCRIFLVDWTDAVVESELGCSVSIDLHCSEHIFRRLHHGESDVGIVFTPDYHPDLEIAELFNERFVMVSNVARTLAEVDNNRYVEISCSPRFKATHTERLPQLCNPRYSVGSYDVGIEILRQNGGALYLPYRVAQALCERHKITMLVEGAPELIQPVYSVVPTRRSRNHAISGIVNSLNTFFVSD
ncbi:MAG: LysR family transcriptional regulator [Pseudomonadota bacterium]